jgi:hypothetical protein
MFTAASNLDSFLHYIITEFAEKYVSKAMNLMHFTSPSFAVWKEMIQDAYFYILKKKADLEKGRRMFFLNNPRSGNNS